MSKADQSKFREWINELDEEVIQGEFGYERGEFNVYPDHWYSLFRKGLTPRQAWQRAMDAHKDGREEDERKKAENWDRIQKEDAAAIARLPAPPNSPSPPPPERSE